MVDITWFNDSSKITTSIELCNLTLFCKMHYLKKKEHVMAKFQEMESLLTEKNILYKLGARGKANHNGSLISLSL